MVKDYIEFQDRNAPLAYLISIRLYATWLHGDERGSMNRRTNNLYGTPKNPFNVNLAKHEISLLKHSPLWAGTRPIRAKLRHKVLKKSGKLYLDTNHWC